MTPPFPDITVCKMNPPPSFQSSVIEEYIESVDGVSKLHYHYYQFIAKYGLPIRECTFLYKVLLEMSLNKIAL